MLKRRSSVSRGFSLIELLVIVVMVGILMALALPSFSLWIKNAQVRVVSDALQSGLRLAQTEAVRRYRQVVFFRTTSKACTTAATADSTGPYWQARTIAALAGDPVEVVQCGVLTDVADGISLSGPTAMCFSADGRQVANAATGVTAANCTLNAIGAASAYEIKHPNSDRRLLVRVSLAGSVRICDPLRNISSYSDGCPP